MAAQPVWVALGRIVGVFGVRGWVKVESYTDPRANILRYGRWWLGKGDERREVALVNGRGQGRGIVVALEGVEDRDQARALIGCAIAVPRSALPETDGYYWADLIGLVVENRQGVELGRISGHVPTGGHDVMVVTAAGGREQLIPWALGVYVDVVDMEAGRVIVDWHPED